MENEQRTSNNKLEHRLTKLESDVGYIKSQVDNHIPGQVKEVKDLVQTMNKRLWAFQVSFILALLGLLVAVLYR